MKSFRALTVTGLLLCAAPLAAAEARIKIATLEVQTTGVDAQVGPVLSEVLTTEIDALGRFDVIAGRDIDAMIGFEKQKELVACNDASCVAEIGGALGVDFIVASQVGKVGDTFVVNMKLINIKQTRVERRAYETVTDKADALIHTVKIAVRKLFADTPPQQPAAADPAEPVAKKEPEGVSHIEPRSMSMLPLLLWGAGGIALAAGGFMQLKARGHAAHANDPEYVGGQLEVERAESAQEWALLCTGIGMASGLAGLLFYLLDEPPVVVPASDGRSVGAALTVTF